MPVEPEVPGLPLEVKSITIKEQKTFDGLPFPLILSPADDFKDKTAEFWKDWVKRNQQTIEKLLLKYGAILYRDFPLDTPKYFDDFAQAFGYREFPYLGGLSIRVKVVGNVFTSTEAPPGAAIPFHHEMAHVRDYPLVLFFYCDVASKEGGRTPIALSSVIYRKMAEREPELVRRLEKEGLRYVRVAPDGNDESSSLGRGWQSTFLTTDKVDAERKANEAGYDFEWLEDGSMKTVTCVLPAIRVDKRTGQKMWFNSISNAYMGWQDARNDRKKSVIFPNGDTLRPEAVETLKEVLDEASVSFYWKHSDLVMIDNRLVLHAREDHFVPPRRILASLYTDHQGPLSFLE